jgi:hypothetical protein
MAGSRFTLGCVGALVVAFGMTWACLPHTEGDFEDFQVRAANLPKPNIEASTFEAAPPPTNAVEGLYYGACVSELAFGQPSKAFNFYTLTKYTPDTGSGAKLELSIQPLAVVNNLPPPTIAKSGAVGDPIPAPLASVAATGRYRLELGTVHVPGKANPISGSDVEILRASLDGLFAEERFCARLGGEVTQPVAAARTLDPPQNICQFYKIKDGDPTPTLSSSDFQPTSCPVN